MTRAARLQAAIREVLAKAVAKGGSTLRDLSNAWGESGYFQLEAMVYDRAGEPCRVCGIPIRTIRQGARATYFCPVCQKSGVMKGADAIFIERTGISGYFLQ